MVQEYEDIENHDLDHELDDDFELDHNLEYDHEFDDKNPFNSLLDHDLDNDHNDLNHEFDFPDTLTFCCFFICLCSINMKSMKLILRMK